MSDQTSVCVYCLVAKPLSAFNRGHVIPKSFGGFKDNLVLHGVECEECNGHFGKKLELALARDSKEGLDRFEHGVVRPKNGRQLHLRRISIESRGRFEGASLEADPTAPSDQFRVRPRRELGFSKSPDGPFSWRTVDSLLADPSSRPPGDHVLVAGSMSKSETEDVLGRLGMHVESYQSFAPPVDHDGKVETTTRGRIDQTILRGISKIAFGYLAHEYPGIARMPAFDEIRRYICVGELTDFDPVAVTTDQIIAGVPADVQLVVHVVAVRWEPKKGQVVAQVSLFGWVQYQVTLSRSRFDIPPTVIDSGHAFNTYTKQILRLTRDPRVGSLPVMVTREEFEKSRAPSPSV